MAKANYRVHRAEERTQRLFPPRISIPSFPYSVNSVICFGSESRIRYGREAKEKKEQKEWSRRG